MIITETGILVSTDPNMRDPVPLNFKIEGGQVGDNTVRATGLTGNTTYYAQSYFVKDGIYIRQKGLTEFRTAAQAEVLKIKNAYAGSNTIGITKNGSPNNIAIDYSTDQGSTWRTWNSANGSFSVNLAQDGEVWLKGENSRLGSGTSDYFRFTSSEPFDCEGNLSALMRNDLTAIPDYCFYYLFDSSKIRTAPSMPSWVQGVSSCYGMFRNCSYLTTLPSSLPSTVLDRSCYGNMFYGCTSISSIPSGFLPATTLATYCYSGMFQGCTALSSIPSNLLPATTLTGNCYSEMFRGCTAISSIPSGFLPATSIASYCYRGMFRGCTAISNLPSNLLPATTLANYCYSMMFEDCTSISSIPSGFLPATTLFGASYSEMFRGCTALSTVPADLLPATTLTGNCYSMMFYGCSSLTQSPDLPAPALEFYSYYMMFKGCSLLNRIVCYATSWNTTNALDWVDSVALSGDFYNLGGASIPIDNRSGVPIGWTLHTSLHDPLTITNGESGQNTITLTKTGSPQDITLEYSTDNGSTWTSWSSANGNLSITIEDGESVMFRGNNSTFSYDSSNFYKFGSTGKFSLSGDIMSLLSDNVSSVPVDCFRVAFVGAKVTSVSSGLLPANNLGIRCYEMMFDGCTSLTQAPALPATELGSACYSGMFSGCTSLTQAPALPATTLASQCYSSMFYNCTSLTQAPALPATTLDQNCYNGMFRGCTSLTQAPAIPATTIAISCYQEMFAGCTSLTQVPALPATTLATACYRGMFNHCTALTSLPENLLPATTLTSGCYHSMFAHCTSLTQAPALPATTLAPHCYDSMFLACSLTQSPALSATTLADSCYYQMFANCSSLNQAPALPATTLAPYCYYLMFAYCISIRRIVTYASNISATRCLDGWVEGFSSVGDFYNLGGATYPSGDNGIPSGWTVHTSL